jgi:hypothetical protein
MARYSVILPAYNVARHLLASLEGLTSQQTADEMEIIVVDNNSTDDTVAIARQFPRVRVLHEPVQSSYAARNRGVRESSGEYLAFLDPDCRPEPTWLAALARGMQNANAHVVLGRRSYGDGWPLSLLSATGALVAVPWACLLLAFGGAVGLLVTPIGLLYDDIGRILALGLSLMFFLVPIVYPVATSGAARMAIIANPAAVFLVDARDAMLTGRTAFGEWGAIHGALTLVLLVAAFGFLRAARPHLAARAG